MATSNTQTTPEGTEFSITGGRVVFPDNGHEHGGGVALTDSLVSEMLAFPDSGHDEQNQIEWEFTGEVENTRVGDSKVLEVSQTSFGRTRTVRVTLVDIADANVEV